jgi:hypothetical protein
LWTRLEKCSSATRQDLVCFVMLQDGIEILGILAGSVISMYFV